MTVTKDAALLEDLLKSAEESAVRALMERDAAEKETERYKQIADAANARNPEVLLLKEQIRKLKMQLIHLSMEVENLSIERRMLRKKIALMKEEKAIKTEEK